MNVLVACECSGIVRDAFIAWGHDAMSCDLQDTEREGPHYKGDVRDVLVPDWWDLMIAHPTCTDLAVSGSKHFAVKRADGRMQRAFEFFMLFINAPIPKKVVENPVSVIASMYRKSDQTIQPWWFGHPEFKATCLWLEGVDKLVPTNKLTPPAKGTEEHKAWSRIHRMPPGPNRARDRSRTFTGIAEAMAGQWGFP